MISKVIKVNIPGEIERNAALLVQTAGAFESRIHVKHGNKTINAKSIMGIMSLSLCNNEEIEVEADGADEELAVDTLCNLISTDFYE